MKNNPIKVFALGAASACLVMGVAYSTVGAARNIAVEEGIRMQINNAAFVPKDAKGNAVSPFLYNGTTYVPMRPLCEAIGLTVSYDSKTKTVSIVTPSGTTPTTPPAGGTTTPTTPPADGTTTPTTPPASGSQITVDNAKMAAAADAGVAVANAKFTKSELKQENGVSVYEIEFTSGSKKYEYEIDAKTGKVLKKESDNASDSSKTKISETEAKEIAQKKAGVSDAKFTKCELKEDDKGSIYEVEFTSGSKKYEYTIDAVTGKIKDSDDKDSDNKDSADKDSKDKDSDSKSND